MKYTESDVQLLADVFTRIVVETYTENELDEVIRLNKADGYDSDVCHTHDFYDANEIMAQAFHEIHGRELFVEDTEDSQDDMDLVNKAWAQAKNSDFDVKNQ